MRTAIELHGRHSCRVALKNPKYAPPTSRVGMMRIFPLADIFDDIDSDGIFIA